MKPIIRLLAGLLLLFNTGVLRAQYLSPPEAVWQTAVNTTTAAGPGTTWMTYNTTTFNWGASTLSFSTGLSTAPYGYTDPVTVAGHDAYVKTPYLTANRGVYYFRRTFSVGDLPSDSTISVGVKCDDGAVVYINGQEIGRAEMPTTGVITDTTAAKQVCGFRRKIVISNGLRGPLKGPSRGRDRCDRFDKDSTHPLDFAPHGS
jgi:hypothetical protein